MTYGDVKLQVIFVCVCVGGGGGVTNFNIKKVTMFNIKKDTWLLLYKTEYLFKLIGCWPHLVFLGHSEPLVRC
jgi:hypothetical protein